MERAFKKIKLKEEEVKTRQAPGNHTISSAADWDSQTDLAIHQEAIASFEDFIEFYKSKVRWMSLGHPVAIKVEEEEEEAKQPAQVAVEEPSVTSVNPRTKRAIRREEKQARKDSRERRLPKRVRPSPRLQELSLALAATQAANQVNFEEGYQPAENVERVVLPLRTQNLDIQLKEERWDV